MDSQLLLTGNPAVMPRMDSQRRGPEVLLWEIAIDLLEARFWIISELLTIRKLGGSVNAGADSVA